MAGDRGGTIPAADRAGDILSGEEVSAVEGLPTEEVSRRAGGATDRAGTVIAGERSESRSWDEEVLPAAGLVTRELAVLPVVINSDDPRECDRVADALALVIRQSAEPVLLVASADLTHYEPRAVVEQNDTAIIEAIRHLDVEELEHRLQPSQPIVCGRAVIRTAMSAAARLGATGARVVRYATSADAGGDPHSAIGYAGIVFN